MNNNPEKKQPELSEDIEARQKVIKDHADMPEVKKIAELLDQPEVAKEAFFEFAQTKFTAAFCYFYLFKNEPWFEEALFFMVLQNPEVARRCADEIKDKELRERVIVKAEELSIPQAEKWRELINGIRRRKEQGHAELMEFLVGELHRKDEEILCRKDQDDTEQDD